MGKKHGHHRFNAPTSHLSVVSSQTATPHSCCNYTLPHFNIVYFGPHAQVLTYLAVPDVIFPPFPSWSLYYIRAYGQSHPLVQHQFSAYTSMYTHSCLALHPPYFFLLNLFPSCSQSSKTFPQKPQFNKCLQSTCHFHSYIVNHNVSILDFSLKKKRKKKTSFL